MITAPEIFTLQVGEVANAAVSFLNLLDTGETVSSASAPAVAGLTLSNVQENDAVMTIDGVSHTAGQAVQLTITPSAAGSYTFQVQATTSAGQTRHVDCRLEVLAA